MRKTSIEKVVTGTLLIAAGMGVAHSQAPAVNQYPSRPIRIIAPGPGGTVDLSARVLAQSLSEGLQQNVVVENRPTNMIPTQMVAKAQPDGHTLLLTGGALWVTPLVQDNVGYDPFRDFTPIALIYTSGYVLVVHPAVPANSVKELIALAKAKPGTVKFATTGGGSGSTLAAALLAYMTHIDIEKINYKSTGTALIDVVGGRVDALAIGGGATSQFVKAGKLKALGFTGPKSSPLFPGVPPIAEAVPGYESLTAGGLHAPAKTPAAIVKRLNQEVARALSRADVKEKLLESGSEPAPPGPPEMLAKFMRGEVARLAPMIKATGLRGGE